MDNKEKLITILSNNLIWHIQGYKNSWKDHEINNNELKQLLSFENLMKLIEVEFKEGFDNGFLEDKITDEIFILDKEGKERMKSYSTEAIKLIEKSKIL